MQILNNQAWEEFYANAFIHLMNLLQKLNTLEPGRQHMQSLTRRLEGQQYEIADLFRSNRNFSTYLQTHQKHISG